MGQVASERLAISLDERRVRELPPLKWATKDLGLKIDLEDKGTVQGILDTEDFGRGLQVEDPFSS